ncbi:MAG TPA: S8 family serine peptidase [Baekduia sp.]|uniref:S8 family serine peptidase n=1 Tax=Baekduia sp. TaxID=2600305 RepID=UPI002C9EC124|nr:S8 family serine peptidase [Baekduia sp.]HMJ36905.1 S8 family serine peptidase [Baekduia sp.]
MLCALGAIGAATAVGGVVATGSPAQNGDVRTYVVLLDPSASTDQATQSIQAAGGSVERINTAVGVATVRSTAADFAAEAVTQPGIQGTAADRSIGQVPAESRTKRDRDAIEELTAERNAARGQQGATPDAATPGDPLASLQWDMQMMHATVTGSYREQQGTKDVRVGIIDTGVDGSHPDIAPNFDAALSRNFTVDDPVIDGACDTDPDGSCEDPANVDENGHGTHVAGTIGAPLNGLGMAGVAPRVDIVNLRAGQDSGYFFIQPVVDALTYAGDHGIDVVNMSFYIDPWLYNCASNPADTPEQQQEQQTIIEATKRALAYAHDRGVTLVAADGNENTDLGRPEFDPTSPDYPTPKSAHDRNVDNSCLSLPTEGEGVIGVTSVGPSGRKAYYSNYGTEQADVSAPGGDYYDFPGTDKNAKPTNLILAPYPEAVGRAADPATIDAAGNPTTPFVVKDTKNGQTAYYQYIQGTSMASPHAVGVAALIVSQFGKRDRFQGGLTLAPDRVQNIMQKSATDTACPSPRQYEYGGLPADYNAYCEGPVKRNGFYGDGVVDALAAIHARD